jgi:hypothetical protein
MRRIIVILIIFFGLNTSLFCDDFLSEVSALERNQKVQLIEEDPSKIGYIYVFFKSDECISCFSHIKFLFNTLSDKFDNRIGFYGFLENQTQEYANNYKKINKLTYPIIGDKIEIYKELYKVKVLPIYYIFDAQGHLIATDKCGGTRISDSEVINIFNQLKEKHSENNKFKDIKELKRIRLKDKNASEIFADKSFSVTMMNDNIHFLLLNSQSKCIYKYDTSGKYKDIFYLYKFNDNKYHVRQPLSISVTDKEGVFLYNDLNNEWNYSYFLLNLKNKTIKEIPFDYPWPPYNASGSAYIPKNHYILLGLNRATYTREPSYITNEFNTLMLIDTNGKEIKRFGKPDEVFQKFKISKIFDNNNFFIDHYSNIYEYQGPSTKVNIYTAEGQYIKSIPMRFDSSIYRYISYNLDTTGNVFKNWLEWNGKCSICRYLYYDTKSNKIVILYSNTTYPEEIEDPLSENAIRRYYLHIANFDGSNCYIKDIEIPNNSKVIHFSNNYFILLESIAGKFDLVLYKIIAEEAQSNR